VYASTYVNIHFGSEGGRYDWQHELFSLAQYMFWPDGKIERESLLQGTSTHGQWDFVIILHDPYIVSRMPGWYAEGVKMVADKVRAGGATPLLLMQWPGPSSSANLTEVIDIAYRVGAGAGVDVVPAGKAWELHGNPAAAGAHPTPDGALIAAAAIYSEITDDSAASMLANTNDKQIANQVLAVVQEERARSNISGVFSLITPFSMGAIEQTGAITMCHDGSSSESGITTGLISVASSFDGSSISRLACVDVTDEEVGFNLGRGNDNFEAWKRYRVDSKWPLAFGFPMQERSSGAFAMPYGLDHRQQHANDLDICEHMIEEGEVTQGARCVPINLMYNKMKEYDSEMPSHGDWWHMSTYLDLASASYIYTLASRRQCQEADEPSEVQSDSWRNWLAQRIGCDTAWRLATLQSPTPFSGPKATTTATTTTSTSTTTTTTVDQALLWPPFSDIYHRCATGSGCTLSGMSQFACQQLAVDSGLTYFEYEASRGCCAPMADCTLTDSWSAWQVYHEANDRRLIMV
jgi:hypothetical protein